jgi:hypothetical protein
MRTDKMPKTKSGGDNERGQAKSPIDGKGERSSPGSHEDGDEAADLQPDEVEGGDPAR